MSDVIPVTGKRASLSQEEIDALNNETASVTSTQLSQDGLTTFNTTSAHTSAFTPVRQQPGRAAKKRLNPLTDDTQSVDSTISDVESVGTQQSVFDTDVSETSSIAYTAPSCK